MNIKIDGLKAAAWSTIFFTLGLLKIAPAFAERMELVTYYPNSSTGQFKRVDADGVTVGHPLRASEPGGVQDADLPDGTLLVRNNVGIGTTTPSEQLEITGNFRLPPTTATGGVPAAGVIFRGPDHFLHEFGTGNAFFGVDAGNFTMTGNLNTGLGEQTLTAVTTGSNNTAVGYEALFSNTEGTANVALGNHALLSNTTGGGNTAVGSGGALSNNITGDSNTAVGGNTLTGNTDGISNTAVGRHALTENTMGNNNTALGVSAGVTGTVANANTTGSNNTFIGYLAGPGTATQLTNATAIGANALVSASNSLVLGGTGADAVKVGIGMEKPDTALDLNGALSLRGIATTSAPAASPLNQGRIYFDSTQGGFRISDNNQTYAPLTPIVVKLKDNWQTDTTTSATDWTTDNRLKFTVGPNERWAFQMYVPYYTVNTDFDLRLTTNFVPNGTNQYWVMAPFKDAAKYHTLACGFNYPGVPAINCSAIEKLEGSDNNQGLTLLATVVGIIQGDTTGGEVVLEWKANKNNRDCGVRDGGYLTAYRQSNLNN